MLTLHVIGSNLNKRYSHDDMYRNISVKAVSEKIFPSSTYNTESTFSN